MSCENIIKEREIYSTRALVFEALTDPAEIKSYFPVDEVIASWEEGGLIKFIGEESGVDEGVIDIFEPNSCFQYSYWNENHAREKEVGNFVTINYTIENTSVEGKVKLTMKQSNLPFPDYKSIMSPIWEDLLDAFEFHLERKKL